MSANWRGALVTDDVSDAAIGAGDAARAMATTAVIQRRRTLVNADLEDMCPAVCAKVGGGH